MKPIIEICAGSYEDCFSAALGGADRVELNAALSVGGLTPGAAVLEKSKAEYGTGCDMHGPAEGGRILLQRKREGIDV